MTTQQSTPVFDDFNVDLVVKVLSHTLFSPFFMCFVPLLNFARGHKVHDLQVKYPAIWTVGLCVYYVTKFSSRMWRNQGSWLYRPARADWGEQIVVITGGSSGVGALLANTLAVRNVTVVVLDINPIVTENYNISYYKCNVSSWEEVQAVAQKIKEEIGDPTMIINNAGVVQGKTIIDLSPDDIKQTMGVNVLAHFWTLKAFLPAMIEAKVGHVVTISSVLGLAGVAQLSDYGASKAAVVTLHESLRSELDYIYKTPAIRTTLLIPGQIHTPLFSHGKFSTNPLIKFLAPALAPHTVVKAIIAALDEQESRTLYMPFYASCLEALEWVPLWARDGLQWLTGADWVMRDFVKVSGLRPEEQTGRSGVLREDGYGKAE